ncbi:P-loop containing nucleoside triphosphate hydrolase protein [Auriscalpium vulgare]|uniref:P-loop containing nucleoside triphosphate hydrolase protein n=1 Tax=Auriscalpium vulgare TaxID=40419 RepID=A0ACB8RB00_9AGAM|nr:P-loop containing nucleoside triphosphate hydrolase protein [Auriscalpium vulgare]
MGAEAKQKTKAKKRYLKAKKDRRKQRKAVPAPHAADGPDDEGVDEGSGTASGSELDSSEAEQVKAAADEKARRKAKKAAKKTSAPDETQEPERPRKRRRLSPEIANAAPDVVDVPLAASPPPDRRTPTPPPPSTLPAFPLPTRPDAPARAELASQGLDRALARAQLVDPGVSTPLGANDDDGAGLGERTRGRLRELGITELFAVQTTLLPLLLPADRLQRALYLPYDSPRDICVSAPTGSGKTLAYVLPIIETLSARIVTRLRALIVLPTRDLVTQVRETFEEVGKGRGLKVGTATGQHSFAHEQAQLVADKSSHLQGGSSKVDILICTPGRLIDHLHGTPNFSLQHLRFMVIDEADRLLAQSFQDWLAQVLVSTRPPPASDAIPPAPGTSSIPCADALAPAFMHLLPDAPTYHTDLDEKKEPSCQKLLFSATLMSDPGKIAALELRDPQYIVVQSPTGDHAEGILGVALEQFSMPATLKEHMVVCDASQKPLVLFHLVHSHDVTNALIFTKSTESTLRLVRLFDFFETASAAAGGRTAKPVIARAYSSDLSPAERKTILDQFKAREIDILVCSDLISRGIDISHVAHVVSYDVPVDMRKYVHRAGRTARAGRAGDAWTLVEEQEARYFKNMLRIAGHMDAVGRVRVSDKQLAALSPFYESALRSLKEVYARE